jgi:hypothetical protein
VRQSDGAGGKDEGFHQAIKHEGTVSIRGSSQDQLLGGVERTEVRKQRLTLVERILQPEASYKAR